MNNPLELIKRDHETIEELFVEYENLESDAVSERQELLQKIGNELLEHIEMEETLCYPRFKEAFDPRDQQLIEESYVEHQEVRTILDTFKNTEETVLDHASVIEHLIEHVRLHIQLEEREIFPRVIKEIPTDILSNLGDEIITFKESRGGATP